MKTRFNLLFAGLSLIPFNLTNYFLQAKNEPKKEKEPCTEIAFKSDSYSLKYLDDFSNERNFWVNVFTLDSSQSFIYHRKTMEITDTISTPKEEKYDETILDSVHKANNAKPKTFGIIYGRKQKMRRATERAFIHLDYIVDSLKKHALPESLAVFPYFESEYQNNAVSKAGAKGMWQFMKGTARDYGLKINSKIDEREDPQKSLSAFIKYMEDAYKKFDNDPLLALVSYNCGMNSKYFKDWKNKNNVELIKSMGFASRQYYGSFLASLDILGEPCKYFPDIKLNMGKK